MTYIQRRQLHIQLVSKWSILNIITGFIRTYRPTSPQTLIRKQELNFNRTKQTMLFLSKSHTLFGTNLKIYDRFFLHMLFDSFEMGSLQSNTIELIRDLSEFTFVS